MFAKCIMIQGTSSHAGKSFLTAGLCRLLYREGFKVAPFKSQNMALNSYVTRDGLEIGRAQGVQAEAAGVAATVEMNPILLKPKEDMVAQVVVMGKPLADMSARDYRERYIPQGLKVVNKALESLRQTYDVIVIEGAGSPAEINLRDRDIVNMKIAELAEAPVIIVGDIDRGGVFASIVGTMELLTPGERSRVAGFVINKFRGDPSLLTPALDFLETRTGLPVLGVIPWMVDPGIEEEDSVSLHDRKDRPAGENQLDIAVIRLPRISNYTDFAPLEAEPDVSLRYVSERNRLGFPDAVILPGTKNTTSDLQFLYHSGLAQAIRRLCLEGVPVAGICGGFQMLGDALHDPLGTESSQLVNCTGLGLLPLVTTFTQDKLTRQVQARVSNHEFWGQLTGMELEGYEIRHGRSEMQKEMPSIVVSGSEQEIIGAASLELPVFGTYLHDVFSNDTFRRYWLNDLRRRKGLSISEDDDPAGISTKARREESYDRLAEVLKEHLDMDRLYHIMGVTRP